MIKRFGVSILLSLLVAACAFAGNIKVWVSHEGLTSADLNANFAYIINHMVGGQGARLVDADVNASAAIKHSKLQYPGLVPKAWAKVANCDCGAVVGTVTCSYTGSGILYIKSSGSAGVCNIFLNYTLNNSNFAATATTYTVPDNIALNSITTGAPGVNLFKTITYDTTTGLAANNIGFSIMVMDDDSGP